MEKLDNIIVHDMDVDDEEYKIVKEEETLTHKETSGRGRLWWPALGVVKTLHTDNKQHKENMKT